MSQLTRRAALVGLSAITLAAPRIAIAQGFPARQIQLIVPFAAGGGTDLVARHYAAAAARLQNVAIQVVPTAGAGGARGSKLVAEAPADGHTLLFGTMGSNITAPLLNDVGYQPDSFEPIAIVSAPTFIIAARPDFAGKTMAELIVQARRQRLTYGSSGAGGSAHVAMELFARKAGVEFRHVPFNGSSEAVVAVMGRHVNLALPSTGSVLEQVRSGQIHGIVITADERTPQAPQIPTVKESGIDFSFATWRAVLAPRGTPPAIQQFLVELSARVTQDAEFIAQATRVEGEPPIFVGGANFRRQLERETAEQREIAPTLRRR
jgi:tripartite-type tricarboxylate transporter receptor subunit TctC